MGAGSVSAVCTVCGREPRGATARSLRGELTCLSHPSTWTCAFCARPGNRGEPGWCDLGVGTHRCPACAHGSVDTHALLRSHVPEVRRIAGELGFGLVTRVRVVFGTAEDLRSGPGDPVRGMLGVTELRVTGVRSAEATVVRVLRGLPSFVFGRVVAHELGHAWLGQFGARPSSQAVEEGLCELVSYAWLKRSGTPFAAEVRDRMWTNSDPVYGDGFRAVHAAVRQHGLAAVLESMSRFGDLPVGPSQVQRSR
jgi:hypothetical protein